MRQFITILGLQLRLQLVGRTIWIAGLIMVVFGIWEGSAIREAPYGAWGIFMGACLLTTLLLIIGTGDQITRDRDLRQQETLLSTPLASWAYVMGKYVATFLLLLGLSFLEIMVAIFMDQIDTWQNPPAILGHSKFPALGPVPYLGTWMWLAPTSLIIGAALALALTTLSHGQRLIAAAGILVLWIVPVFEPGWPELIDVSGVQLQEYIPFYHLTQAFNLATQEPSTPANIVAVVHLAQMDLPPAMPTIFVLNRLLFLSLAVALLILTVVIVQRRRVRFS